MGQQTSSVFSGDILRLPSKCDSLEDSVRWVAAIGIFVVIAQLLASQVKAAARRSQVKASMKRLRRDRDAKRQDFMELLRNYPHLPSKKERSEIITMTATALLNRYNTGDLTPQEVVSTYCYRALIAGGKFNCNAQEFVDEALEAAEESYRRYRAGTARPLEGLPISVKDCYFQRNAISTCGMGSRTELPPDAEDGLLVGLIREAGGIPFVRTNVPQALLISETMNDIWGTCSNPHNITRSPGGSSGGEGALIAAGGSVLGLGSDIGGSIRIPAMFCGIFGFKPTPMRMSRVGATAPRLKPFIGQEHVLPTCGPMGRSVDDLVLIMRTWLCDAMWRADPIIPRMPLDTTTLDDPFRDLSKLRVGYYTHDAFFQPCATSVRAVEMAVENLERAGVECVPFQPPNPVEAAHIMYGLLSADNFSGMMEGLNGEPIHKNYTKVLYLAWLPKPVRKFIELVLRCVNQPRPADLLSVTAKKDTPELWSFVARKQAYQKLFFGQFNDAGLDAIITPGLAVPAYLHGSSRELTSACSQSFMYNVLHMPAGIVPMTTVRRDEQYYSRDLPSYQQDQMATFTERNMKDSAGLPVGVQVAALPFHDEEVLRIMKILEVQMDITVEPVGDVE